MRTAALVCSGLSALALVPAVTRTAEERPVPVGVAAVDVTPEGPIRLVGYERTYDRVGGGRDPAQGQGAGDRGRRRGGGGVTGRRQPGRPGRDQRRGLGATQGQGWPDARAAGGVLHAHALRPRAEHVPRIHLRPPAPRRPARADRTLHPRPHRRAGESGAGGPGRPQAGPAGVVDGLGRLRGQPPGAQGRPMGRLRRQPERAGRPIACRCFASPAPKARSGRCWRGTPATARPWARSSTRSAASGPATPATRSSAATPAPPRLVVIGCGADANPEPRRDLDDAKRYGAAVAREVDRLLGGTMAPLPGRVATAFRRIELPFGALPTREHLESQAKANGPEGFFARSNLDRLNRGEALPKTLTYPVQTWCFGDAMAMVFLGGEVVVDYALRVKWEGDAGGSGWSPTATTCPATSRRNGCWPKGATRPTPRWSTTAGRPASPPRPRTASWRRSTTFFPRRSTRPGADPGLFHSRLMTDAG